MEEIYANCPTAVLSGFLFSHDTYTQFTQWQIPPIILCNPWFQTEVNKKKKKNIVKGILNQTNSTKKASCVAA